MIRLIEINDVLAHCLNTAWGHEVPESALLQDPVAKKCWGAIRELSYVDRFRMGHELCDLAEEVRGLITNSDLSDECKRRLRPQVTNTLMQIYDISQALYLC